MQLMKRFEIDLRSLPAQMILSLIGLVFLTAAAAGVPAMWLIHGQLERQAWAQVEQGSRAARALYVAQQSELTSLATLTAQRPTLRDLLAQGDQASMQAYLRTLQAGAGLDLVLVCDPNQQMLAQAGEAASDALCAATPSAPTGFRIASVGTAPQVWLFAAQPVGDKGADSRGMVIAGVALDDEFSVQMRCAGYLTDPSTCKSAQAIFLRSGEVIGNKTVGQ